MKIEQNYSIEKHNTFHIPVKTRWFVEYDDEIELKILLKDEYFQEFTPLHIGEGSNLLFINDFNGIIFHSHIIGMAEVDDSPESVLLRIGAAEHWDNVVTYAVLRGWGGIENLSHIPGEAGAAAVQNIGAYGVEIKDVIETVEAYNQLTYEKRIFTNEECNFGYRHSYFKETDHDPYIITNIYLRLQKQPVFNLDYGNLVETLDGCKISLRAVRNAIIKIRQTKLPDPSKLGNAGSFFMNPYVCVAHYEELLKKYPNIPSYPVNEKVVKIPAAWLIEQCKLKGKTIGGAAVHDKQPLVIINKGTATADDIASLSSLVCDTVKEKFGIELNREVLFV